MKPKKKKSERAQGIDPRLVSILDAFATERSVSRGGGKGFSSRAMTVNGKIFAMMASREQFVVKLPKERVGELVAAGKGRLFDPGHGRLMKEWLVVDEGEASRLGLAKEAYRFVRRK